MRLTLRTLLAYLDDILDSDDREAIGKKIEESEFARSLVHRSRDVTRRLRLSAPEVIGAGFGDDANSVAEYLDNTMAPEQIQQFEKICLESDLHLAEVASCHHVLTMVLGEPAHVGQASRERMYQLKSAASDVEEQRAGAKDAVESILSSDAHHEDTAAVDQNPTPAPPLQKELVGEGTGGGTSRFWCMALTAIVAAVVTGGLLFVVDPNFFTTAHKQSAKTSESNSTTTKTESAQRKNTSPGSNVEQNDIQPPAGGNGFEAPGAEIKQPPSSVSPPPFEAVPDTADSVPQAPTEEQPPPSDLGPAGPPGTEPAIEPGAEPIAKPGADRGETEGPVERPGDEAAPPPGDVAIPFPTDGDAPPAAAADGAETEPASDELTPLVEVPPTKAKGPTTDPNAAVKPEDNDPLAKVDPAPNSTDTGAIDDKPTSESSAVVGRLLSPDQVVLSTATELDLLTRLPPRAPLHAGDKLIVIPAVKPDVQRPMISIGANTVELDGGTAVLLGEVTEDSAQLAVLYGRIITRTLAKPNAVLILKIGSHEGVITYGDAESTLGVEVRPYRTLGTDPEQEPSNMAVDLYVDSGEVIWKTSNGEKTIKAPSRLVLSPHPDDAPSAANSEMPIWLREVEIKALDRRAVPIIEDSIRSGRSIKLSLAELTSHRRAEIRRLACRCSAHVGYFDPLIHALNNKDEDSRWTQYVADLREAVARDSATAVGVRETFEKIRSDSAPELYRMLWGYSPTDLREGEQAKKLVDYLNHQDLDFRVLSFWNLRDFTGMGLNYHPEASTAKRRISIERWKNRLQSGELTPAGGPVELPMEKKTKKKTEKKAE